ncbi:hypothetical protein HHK36_003410 [Tetracentron sinense]|uniref:Uncharacterized protein n=1 Tax=Tetracentron sinense TaxID=13715 RepID=A0A834ZTB9_TETSI|nr:hypothetical protein HHK36_003410 [Tetracentron sinense]
MKKQWLVRAFSDALTVASSTSFTRPFCSAISSFPVKKVTKINFDSALEALRSHVRDADFVSVDLEMTGVTSAPWRDSFQFDRFDIRYLKVKDSAEKFAVVQFGVCPFRWDSSKESFIAHPYNFYVFPRKELPADGPSYEFLCQTTSMDFLAKYQFDFNACIHEGISYLSRGQEAEALKRLNLAYEDEVVNSGGHLKEVRDIPLVSMSDVLFTERMKNIFAKWRNGLLHNRDGWSQFEGDSNDKKKFQTIFFKMRPALALNGFTSHQLRLIQLVTRKHFKDLAYVRVNGEKSSEQKLVVYTESKDDKDLLVKEVKDGFRKEAEVKIKAAVGFRHVIDLLSSEKKLIIGHNCFLDVAHIYSKFLGPLPSTVEEFVSSVHKNFPYIIDTKQLLNTDNILQHRMKKKGTSLSSAFALLCPQIASASLNSGLASQLCVKVEVQVDDLRSSNWNSGAKHEAGYDAFMTGSVFVQACSHLGIDFKRHSPSTGLAHNEKLQKHINLLYLSWNNGAIIDLSSGNKITESSGTQLYKKRYPKIVFSKIVLVWGFPSKFKARELRECVSKVFGMDSVISIYCLDETAAFIQFSKEEFVSDFLILKESLDRNNDPISVLHPLSKLLEGGNTCATSYEVYREICSSPISRVLFADQAEAVGIKWKTKVVESREEVETQELESREELESTTKESGTVNSILDPPPKSGTGKRGDVISDPSYHNFSCDEIMDALYVAESQLGDRTRTTNV